MVVKKIRLLICHVLIAVLLEHLYFVIVSHSPLRDRPDIAVGSFFALVLFPWGAWTVAKLNLISVKIERPRGRIGRDGLLKPER